MGGVNSQLRLTLDSLPLLLWNPFPQLPSTRSPSTVYTKSKNVVFSLWPPTEYSPVSFRQNVTCRPQNLVSGASPQSLHSDPTSLVLSGTSGISFVLGTLFSRSRACEIQVLSVPYVGRMQTLDPGQRPGAGGFPSMPLLLVGSRWAWTTVGGDLITH